MREDGRAGCADDHQRTAGRAERASPWVGRPEASRDGVRSGPGSEKHLLGAWLVHSKGPRFRRTGARTVPFTSHGSYLSCQRDTTHVCRARIQCHSCHTALIYPAREISHTRTHTQHTHAHAHTRAHTRWYTHLCMISLFLFIAAWHPAWQEPDLFNRRER